VSTGPVGPKPDTPPPPGDPYGALPDDPGRTPWAESSPAYPEYPGSKEKPGECTESWGDPAPDPEGAGIGRPASEPYVELVGSDCEPSGEYG